MIHLHEMYEMQTSTDESLPGRSHLGFDTGQLYSEPRQHRSTSYAVKAATLRGSHMNVVSSSILINLNPPQQHRNTNRPSSTQTIRESAMEGEAPKTCPSGLLDLPLEIQLEISSYLEDYDIYALRLTCHYLETVIPQPARRQYPFRPQIYEFEFEAVDKSFMARHNNLLVCSRCKKVRPRDWFTPSQQQLGPTERYCDERDEWYDIDDSLPEPEVINLATMQRPGSRIRYLFADMLEGYGWNIGRG